MLLALVILISTNLTAFAGNKTNLVYETTNSESKQKPLTNLSKMK